ncbi:hypothetical protein [Rhodococcus qingshengii]|uniref:hypothetical protein n=1 Tax=Rhodococcus qingshengii TaxID=334542 RepID=UPI001C8B68F5|nr:hypothetical protein [Rhodococcus qingshengii]MBX9150065.1 hypothetical protein [Rhodococcus qingshengii]
MTPLLTQNANTSPLGPYIIYVQEKAAQPLPDPGFLTQPVATLIAGFLAVLGAVGAFLAVVFKDRREAKRARRAAELDALAAAAERFSSAVDALRGSVDWVKKVKAIPPSHIDRFVPVSPKRPPDPVRDELQACRVANAKLRLMGLNYADVTFKSAIRTLEAFSVIIHETSNTVTSEQLDDLELDTVDQLKVELRELSWTDKRKQKKFLKSVRKTDGFKKFERGELDFDAELQETIRAAVAKATGPEPTPSAPNGS